MGPAPFAHVGGVTGPAATVVPWVNPMAGGATMATHAATSFRLATVVMNRSMALLSRSLAPTPFSTALRA